MSLFSYICVKFILYNRDKCDFIRLDQFNSYYKYIFQDFWSLTVELLIDDIRDKKHKLKNFIYHFQIKKYLYKCFRLFKHIFVKYSTKNILFS